MTLVMRLVLAFIAVVTVGLAATVVTSLSLGSFSRDDQNVANSYAAIIAVYEAQMVLSRQDVLRASYFATAQRKYRDEFDGQVANFDRALNEASNLLANTEIKESIDQLDGLTRRWLESAAAPVLSETDETRDLRSKVTDLAGRVITQLNESISQASAAKEHARHIVEVASLSGPAAGILVSILMCIWLLATLQKPMRDLGVVVLLKGAWKHISRTLSGPTKSERSPARLEYFAMLCSIAERSSKPQWRRSHALQIKIDWSDICARLKPEFRGCSIMSMFRLEQWTTFRRR